MAEILNKISIDMGGKEYEFKQTPLGPDTVGTDEIIDGSIVKEDLNEEISSLFPSDASSENQLADKDFVTAIYEGLTQSDYIVTDELPDTGTANTVYRVQGEDSYTDYMWYGDEWKALATYDGQLATAQEVSDVVTDYSYS